MGFQDAFSSAEQQVIRYYINLQNKKIAVYEIKLSNAEDVLRQCLDFVMKDASREPKFNLIFNAKHVKAQTTSLKKLKTILYDYRDLLFSKRLNKFAIMVKSFITHRRVVGMFDEIFDEAGMSREKYNYFSIKDKDQILMWLVKEK